MRRVLGVVVICMCLSGCGKKIVPASELPPVEYEVIFVNELTPCFLISPTSRELILDYRVPPPGGKLNDLACVGEHSMNAGIEARSDLALGGGNDVPYIYGSFTNLRYYPFELPSREVRCLARRHRRALRKYRKKEGAR